MNNGTNRAKVARKWKALWDSFSLACSSSILPFCLSSDDASTKLLPFTRWRMRFSTSFKIPAHHTEKRVFTENFACMWERVYAWLCATHYEVGMWVKVIGGVRGQDTQHRHIVIPTSIQDDLLVLVVWLPQYLINNTQPADNFIEAHCYGIDL